MTRRGAVAGFAGSAALLLGLIAATPAHAIIISGAGAGAAPLNDTPPLNDPGWDRVGMVGTNGSGVYLGNGYVLTAQHVAGKNVITIGGDTFNKISGTTGVNLTNNDPGLSANTDLHLFRVSVPENTVLHGLAPLDITPVSLTSTGQLGTWIATGQTQVQQTRQNFGGGAFGYEIDDDTSRQKRWATVEAGLSASVESFGNDVVAFRSEFTNTLDDGFAASGDSGGALFWDGPPGSEYDQPVLAGISFGIATFEGQPADEAWFGDLTFFVDLFEYRDQLQVFEGDLTGDGAVDTDDLALVLGRFGQSVQSGNYTQGDGTGDGRVDQDDLNLVLRNWTDGGAPSFEAAIAAVPEPGSLVLMGFSALAMCRRRRSH